jgi:hypothetical protein
MSSWDEFVHPDDRAAVEEGSRQRVSALENGAVAEHATLAD